MHLVYSAIGVKNDTKQRKAAQSFNELLLRYRGYQLACNKYCSEIAEIQKRLPGWLPSPPKLRDGV